jgi:hypothetical protein
VAGWELTRRNVVLSALALLIGRGRCAAVAEDDAMDASDQDFGKLNPKAPVELERFAFLLGAWSGEAKLKLDGGGTQTFQVKWVGRTILDGYAIEDEYRMTAASGELIVLGMNFRTYEAARKSWHIKWLNALDGTWTDLGTEEFGGVKLEGNSIIYGFKEPMAKHAYTRAIYTVVSPTRFTWRGEKSEDGKVWREFLGVACERGW